MRTYDEELTPPGGGRMAVAPPGALPPDAPTAPTPRAALPVDGQDRPDKPADPEDFAEAAGVDPSSEDVAEYQRRVDEAAPEPVSEPPD